MSVLSPSPMASEKRPIPRYGDNPIFSIHDDKLDRGRSVGALADLIEDAALDTPIVVGVQGDWGSGKTSVMRLLRDLVESRGHTVIIVTHDNDIAAQADRTVHVRDGKLEDGDVLHMRRPAKAAGSRK